MRIFYIFKIHLQYIIMTLFLASFCACFDNSTTPSNNADAMSIDISADIDELDSNNGDDTDVPKDIQSPNDIGDAKFDKDADVTVDIESGSDTNNVSDISNADIEIVDSGVRRIHLCDPVCDPDSGQSAESGVNCPEELPEEGEFCSWLDFGLYEQCYYCISGGTQNFQTRVWAFECPGPAEQIWVWRDTSSYNDEGYYPGCGRF